MKRWNNAAPAVWIALSVLGITSGRVTVAGETNTEERLRWLKEQNDALQKQLRQQQDLIDSLTRDVAKILTVPETGEVKADFLLGITNLPKY